ncbi:MAG: cupin domain-containing protein [Chloroflexota bacterium]
MRAFPLTDVSEQDVPGCPGVTIRWAISKNVGAPNFALRVISVQPGAATEYHAHPWEHEVYVLEGGGRVRDSQGETAIGPGTCVYVAPDEIHNFSNTGATVLRFICVIPNPKEG